MKPTFKLLLALLLGLCLSQPLLADDNLKLKYYPKRDGDFTLTNQEGKEFSLPQIRGKVGLLFFGYTSCPDVCPTTLLEMKQTLALLGEKAQQVQVLFITLDPERDTAAQLKLFLSGFSPEFLGLTGSREEVDQVAQQYAARYKKRDVGSQAGYLLDHTAFSYLIDQEGKLRYLFPYGTPPDFIAKGVTKLLP